MDIGEGAKKRTLDYMGCNLVTSDVTDDKKHKVGEDSQFPDERGENQGQVATPKTPPSLPPVETDAVAAGTDEPVPAMVTTPKTPPSLPPVETDAVASSTDEPAPSIVVPREGGGGLVLPSAETVAPGAGSEEPSADVIVLGDSPIVVDTPGAGAADPAPEGGDSPGDDGSDYGEFEEADICSPDRDLKLAKAVYLGRHAVKQLKIRVGRQTEVLEAVVTHHANQPAGIIVSEMMHAKLNHYNFCTVEDRKHEGSSYVYVKMSHADLLRFHAKMDGWGEARASFYSVYTVLPIQLDPMDPHQVQRIS